MRMPLTLSFSFPFLSFTSARPLGGFLKIFPVKPPKGRAEGKEKENKRKCHLEINTVIQKQV